MHSCAHGVQVEERVTRYIMTQVLPALTAGGPPALVVSHGLAIKW